MLNKEYYINTVNDIFKNLYIPDVPYTLYEPVHYTVSLSGKKLRPLLCLISCDACCGEIEQAIPAAISIELFHNFTLLHDDIMDNAPIRRGMPTIFKKWGRDIAILSGDVLFAMAYKELSKSSPEIIQNLLELFSKTAIEVCEGQQYDKDFETQSYVSETEYLNMIRLKTSVLIAASLQMGAIAGGADIETQQKFYQLGIKTGMAFQIQDDLLDAYGDENTFGKKTGGDILANKKTYLFVKSYDDADDKLKNKLNLLYSDNVINNEDKINSVLEIFNVLKIKEKTNLKQHLFFEEALAIIDSINIRLDAKDFIKNFIKDLINRTV
jgi:geranylgeranyl diphosphate synthase type II